MKNKELLNICYKFFNSFITSDELIEMLGNIDKKTLSNDEIREMDKLIIEIKEIANNIKGNSEIDSHERWFAITSNISQNEYFNTCFDNLSKYELLEFIAQNIQAPFPPKLNQEEFDSLVKVGIESDKREWLWRLAFNYESSEMNFDLIADYFIKMKDGYYIVELISVVGDCLDIDSIIDKITDKELIRDLKNRKDFISRYVSEEQFNKLVSKLN